MDASIVAVQAAGLAAAVEETVAKARAEQAAEAEANEWVEPTLADHIERTPHRHLGARVEALNAAIRHHNTGGEPKSIVATAEAFFAFLTGKVAS